MQYQNRNILNYLWVVILFMLAIPVLSFSQRGNPKFSHLSTTDGLSQSSVFVILKDYKGFMWFGTREGLNKYDGYKFTVYKNDPENPGSISDNLIYGLMEDATHNLWVVSAGGLDRFDRVTESFAHYNSGYDGVAFRNIFQDSKKRIWISTEGGFCLFDAGKGISRFYKNNDKDSNSLSQNYVYGITEDNYGDLWIATRGGINRFNPETEKFVRYKNDPGNSKSIGAGYAKAVYKDSKGNIWVGTQGSGAALFNRGDNSFINFKHDPLNKNSISHNDILSFTEDSKGKLWVGTENGGISVYDYTKKTFACFEYNENDAYSISGNSVYSLYKDNIGNIWAGTWSGGVNFNPVSGDKFSFYRKIPNSDNSLSNNIVLSINRGPDNNIWIGTDGGGLNRFDPLTHRFTHYRNDKNNTNSLSNDYVLSISEFLPGVLALGFHRGGMELFDIKKQLFTRYPLRDLEPSKLASPSVRIIYRDSQHNLLIATSDNKGVFMFDKRTNGVIPFPPDTQHIMNIGDRSIYVIHETKAGQLWLGGDKGLDLFDRNTKEFIHYQHEPKNKNSISNNTVNSIMEDGAGNLWVGTVAGLNFLNTKTNTFTVFTEKDGLPNNTVWSTQQDRSGNLWISTNNGLSRFTPSTKTFRNYTISDGLQNNTFKAKASYQSPDGEMFFGGVNGFNTFYPDSIKDNDFVPPVYFTDFQVFNKPVAIGDRSPLKQSINEVKEITLSYYQSVFTIEYAALNFTHPEQNKYAYKLEGFDREWNYAGNRRTATYTNLNPGTYVFKVKGTNNDGLWNEVGASMKIIIMPPFWLTWWFIIIVLLIVAGGIFGFYRLRMNIVQEQKVLLQRKVNEQTIQLVYLNEEERKARFESEESRTDSDMARKEAQQANKNLEIKNKELEEFAYVVSHDLQEPLRTTSSFISLLQKQYHGKLDEKADKYFTFIIEASDRMKVLIKNLLDYSRIGNKKELEPVDCDKILHNVLADLNIAISEAGADIKHDPLPVVDGYATELKQLFQNLITNAIKFRKKDAPPEINISVQKNKGYWEFAFKDNGIGIEKKDREKIFVIFQRLHTRTEYEGTGIGLSYCKKIVELHHGKIWVESTPGEGSTFYFTIHSPKQKINEQKIELHNAG